MSLSIKTATKRLAPPLYFGNWDQIVAVRFLARIESCIEAIRACPHVGECSKCGGTGMRRCECGECGNNHYAGCSNCNGQGAEKGSGCSVCMRSFEAHEIEEAVWEIARRQP